MAAHGLRRRGLLAGVGLGALGLLALLASNVPPRLLCVEDPPARADAVLVMSGDVDFERTRAAAALALEGKAPLLVLTGGVVWEGDSAESLRAAALRAGVPDSRIRYENTSQNTRDSVVNVRPILEAAGARTVILVTSPYHQRRACLAARRALPGVRIVNRPVRTRPWPPAGPWWRDPNTRAIVASEYLKLVYYGVRGWL